MTDTTDNTLLTSKEILHKTGISRATLNNYIKVGLLPRPIVKKGGAGQERTRQIGYFPVDALGRIALVKRLKREGNSMAAIVGMLRSATDTHVMMMSADHGELDATADTIYPVGDEQPATKINLELFPDQSNRSPSPEKQQSANLVGQYQQNQPLQRRASDLQLTISDIYSPAYMVNHNCEIEWVNREAEKEIFGRKISEIKKLESRNIFKLFLGWEFQNHLQNCQETITSHMSIMSATLKKSSLATLYSGISKSEIHVLEKAYDFEPGSQGPPVAEMPLKCTRRDGTTAYYRLYAMYFREGVFFFYVPQEGLHHDLLQMLTNRGKVINELLKNRMPSLVSLSVLVADLQDSVRISAELPPQEYFQLINDLWKTVGGAFEKYNGVYGKHVGDGMLYYFLKRPGSNYLLDSVNCALDLRESMRKLSSDWRLRKGWSKDLFLNIAINEGQEFFGAIHSASNVEFTALGDSINFTGRLSDFARNGSIWATKNVIARMNLEDQSMLRYGIQNREQGGRNIVLNSFSRICDLQDETGRDYIHFADIATLPITEIFDRKGQASLLNAE